MAAAKSVGAVNSFDLNYRAKLWASVGSLIALKSTAAHCRQSGCAFRQRRRPSKRTRHRRPRGDGQIEARSRCFFPDDRARRRAVSEHQDGGDDAARGAFVEPSRLGGRVVDRRQALGKSDLSTGCIGPHWRRRRLCIRPHLRPDRGAKSGEPLRSLAHGRLLTTFPGDVTMSRLEEVEAGKRRVGGCSGERKTHTPYNSSYFRRSDATNGRASGAVPVTSSIKRAVG